MPEHGTTPTRLLCFDVGNVLVKLGPSTRSFGSAANASELDRLFRCYGLGGIESTVFFRELKRLSNWRRSLPELRECFIHQRILGLQPGVQQLFQELNAIGIPLALISNTNAAHWEYLVGFSLLNSCHFKLLSFEQGYAKPNEQIFRRLEVQSGFSGAHILFFDDIEENVIAAQNLGWRAVRIDPQSAVLDMRRFLRRHRVI